MLDCGEGSYGQLVRFYGPKDVDTVLSKLRAVFISHLHADHHIGLVGLLKGRKRALPQSPVFLIAPKQIMSWLKLYHYCFEPVLQEFVLVPNGDLVRLLHPYPFMGIAVGYKVLYCRITKQLKLYVISGFCCEVAENCSSGQFSDRKCIFFQPIQLSLYI